MGTAGHIDHGKTSLVKALTGIDTDRLPEEKRRGITIDLGFASWFTDGCQIGFVDVPGHERFVKNMLAGAGGIDAVLLVVAADESIKPQTREHFAICRLLAVRSGVVAITKSDLVEPDILDLVALEVEELVAGSFLEGRPVIPVSSITGAGLDELRAALVETATAIDDRDATRRVFRLPVDRVFTMKGFGSVVTGTTYSGQVRTDAEVEVVPGGLRSRARAIQVHSEPRPFATAGERTSINLADISLDRLRRGQQLVEPGALQPSQIVTAQLELTHDARALREQTRVRFHHLASELLGNFRFIDETANEVRPGARTFVQFRLESPLVAVAGDRFVIRRYSPALTIGGGVILDPLLPKLSRGTRPEILDTLANGSLVQRMELVARLEGLRGLTIESIRARTGLTTGTLRQELRELPHLETIADGLWMHRDAIVEFRRKSIEFLDRWFKANRMAVAVPKSEFVQKLLPPMIDPRVIDFLLADLSKEKIVAVRGDVLEIPGRSKTLGGAEGELARMIELRFAESGLNPPAVSLVIRSLTHKPKMIEGVIAYLVRQGTLVRIAEGVYLHRDALAGARTTIAARKGETLDVGQFKEMFGLSRKVAIPLLELFDREGVTKRVGDSRQVL
ncbi:MAG TPA: selenocysteine-specific translation elongation factor [Thermoanaerobaculia bacterium]|nr:selenocysteine-specific translation elongation factor [Thermoanaerobaculia bacterium]